MRIVEETKKTEIRYSCDTLVAGGGIAGIAAALSAARNGASVILCDREYTLGGLATIGIVTIYLPLCDGTGRQVSFGISEELFRLSIKHGWQARYPKAWLEGGTREERAKKRFEVQYNPHIFTALAEELLQEEGVKLLYGTTVCDTVVKEGRITDVIVENKSGRSAISVKNVIDATGDADVAHLSGQKTVVNPNKNPLAAWYYASGDEGVELCLRGSAPITGEGGEKTPDPLINKSFSGVDAEELTEFMIESRRSMLSDVLKMREKKSRWEPVQTSTIPQVRMTRRIKGVHEMSMSDSDKYAPDSIGMIGNWRKAGPVIEIPFSALYGSDVKNLITAGRCISSVGEMWNITRVIPPCAVTGEAAGAAAAFGLDFESVDIALLQDRLRSAGVKIHRDELD